jgi:hypothetical protein
MSREEQPRFLRAFNLPLNRTYRPIFYSFPLTFNYTRHAHNTVLITVLLTVLVTVLIVVLITVHITVLITVLITALVTVLINPRCRYCYVEGVTSTSGEETKESEAEADAPTADVWSPSYTAC